MQRTAPIPARITALLLFFLSVIGFSCANSTLLEDIATVEARATSVINETVGYIRVWEGNVQGVVNISWEKVPGAWGYHIYYSTTAGESLLGSRFSGIGDDFFQHTGLTSGTTYYYSVTAYDDIGESGASPEKFATVP